jgi:hypothetical protein
MIQLAKYVVCASLALSVVNSPLHAAPSFTLFQVPGAAETHPLSITNNGDVAGYFYDGHSTHGFVRSVDGTITTIDVPGSSDTAATAENQNGTIVGYYDVVASHSGGAFVRAPDGTITTFSVWKTPRHFTKAVAINDAGWMAVEGGSNDYLTDFLRDPSGQNTKLDEGYQLVPHAINSASSVVGYVQDQFTPGGYIWGADGTTTAVDFAPNAINDANSTAGYREEYPAIAIYRNADGTERRFKGPHSGTNGDTFATGINNHDVVVGYYQASPATHGFIWNASTRVGAASVRTVDVPGAAITQILGINDNGDVFGTYQNADGAAGAFVRTP